MAVADLGSSARASPVLNQSLPLTVESRAAARNVSRPLSLSKPQALPPLLQLTLSATARRAANAAQGVSAMTPTP